MTYINNINTTDRAETRSYVDELIKGLTRNVTSMASQLLLGNEYDRELHLDVTYNRRENLSPEDAEILKYAQDSIGPVLYREEENAIYSNSMYGTSYQDRLDFFLSNDLYAVLGISFTDFMMNYGPAMDVILVDRVTAHNKKKDVMRGKIEKEINNGMEGK